MPPWPPALIPCSTMSPHSPAPWPLPSSSASPLGSGLDRKFVVLDQALGMKASLPELTGPRCASLGGFSLHANTHVPAHRREQLERFIRYTARGAVSLERLAGRRQRRSCLGTLPIRGLTVRRVLDSVTVGTLGEAGGVRAPAARPSRALRGLSRPAQSAARGEHPDAAPAGCGGGGGEDWPPFLELGAAPGACVCAGDGHVSLVPTRRAPDHRRHHPGVGDHAHPTASHAGLRPPSHGTCPFSPSKLRLGRLSPLRSDVRAAEGCLTLLSVCNLVCDLSPSLPSRPARGLHPRAPLRRYPLPSCDACPAPAQVARRRATGRSGGLLRRARSAGDARGAGAKRAFILPIRMQSSPYLCPSVSQGYPDPHGSEYHQDKE